MPLTPEQLRFVLTAAHYDWWTKEMQPRLDRAYADIGSGKVPETIQKGLFDASSAGFQAGYSMGYEAAEASLREALAELLRRVEHVNDQIADDGDGHIDEWQAPELEAAISKAKQLLGLDAKQE